jgi:hypothetical protein
LKSGNICEIGYDVETNTAHRITDVDLYGYTIHLAETSANRPGAIGSKPT